MPTVPLITRTRVSGREVHKPLSPPRGCELLTQTPEVAPHVPRRNHCDKSFNTLHAQLLQCLPQFLVSQAFQESPGYVPGFQRLPRIVGCRCQNQSL